MTTESRPSVLDYLALCLLAYGLLNLSFLTTSVSHDPSVGAEMASNTFTIIFALPLTLYLIARYARISNMGDIFGLFVLFFALYFVGSVAIPLAAQEIQSTNLSYIRPIIFSVIFTSALYFWGATLNDAALVKVLRFAKSLLLIASLGTIFSDQMDVVFQYRRTVGSEIERGLGFFGNPNQAAVSALFCFVLVVAYPARSRLLTLAQAGIASTAVIMTFSRMGILTLLLLCLLFVSYRLSIRNVVLFLVGMILLIAALWFTFEYDLLDLTWRQRQRLADVLSILTGQATEQNLGPRTKIFEFGLKKISQVFPWGAGIGKFHALEYGYRSPISGVFYGVHNYYLLILGEAGLLAFVGFLVFWARTIWKSVHSPFRLFAIGTTVVILCSMVTTHGVLAQKQPLAMLALVMVVAARSAGSSKTRFAPETAPSGVQP